MITLNNLQKLKLRIANSDFVILKLEISSLFIHCWTGILVQQGFGSNILNFDQLPFLSPLRYKKVTHLFRKPKAIAIECQPEIG